MHAWLTKKADRLAAATGVPRKDLELSPSEIDVVLELAATAAHESGARTNAPLLCYLLGVARGRTGRGPEELTQDL